MLSLRRKRDVRNEYQDMLKLSDVSLRFVKVADPGFFLYLPSMIFVYPVKKGNVKFVTVNKGTLFQTYITFKNFCNEISSLVSPLKNQMSLLKC